MLPRPLNPIKVLSDFKAWGLDLKQALPNFAHNKDVIRLWNSVETEPQVDEHIKAFRRNKNPIVEINQLAKLLRIIPQNDWEALFRNIKINTIYLHSNDEKKIAIDCGSIDIFDKFDDLFDTLQKLSSDDQKPQIEGQEPRADSPTLLIMHFESENLARVIGGVDNLIKLRLKFGDDLLKTIFSKVVGSDMYSMVKGIDDLFVLWHKLGEAGFEIVQKKIGQAGLQRIIANVYGLIRAGKFFNQLCWDFILTTLGTYGLLNIMTNSIALYRALFELAPEKKESLLKALQPQSLRLLISDRFAYNLITKNCALSPNCQQILSEKLGDDHIRKLMPEYCGFSLLLAAESFEGQKDIIQNQPILSLRGLINDAKSLGSVLQVLHVINDKGNKDYKAQMELLDNLSNDYLMTIIPNTTQLCIALEQFIDIKKQLIFISLLCEEGLLRQIIAAELDSKKAIEEELYIENTIKTSIKTFIKTIKLLDPSLEEMAAVKNILEQILEEELRAKKEEAPHARSASDIISTLTLSNANDRDEKNCSPKSANSQDRNSNPSPATRPMSISPNEGIKPTGSNLTCVPKQDSNKPNLPFKINKLDFSKVSPSFL